MRVYEGGISIRRLAADDMQAILSLVRPRTAGVYRRQANGASQAFQALLEGGSQEGFVAVLHQRIIGFISLHYSKVLHFGGMAGVIQELVVTEEFRGRGVDQALLEYARKRAKELGCAGLEMACSMLDYCGSWQGWKGTAASLPYS